MTVVQPDDADILSAAIDGAGVSGRDWIQAAVIFVVAVVMSRVVKTVVTRVLRRSVDAAVADLVGRLGAYAVAAFGLIYALEQIGVKVGPLLGAMGIVGIALAFALRDILENFVAGLLLQFRRPFSYGDQITSGEVEGTVRAIDARSVSVLTPDGETVYLPSSRVITEAIVNHTERGARRTTVEVGVAYGTDLIAARDIFTAAVREVDGVLGDPGPEVLVEAFGDSSIDFVVRFWHQPSIAEQWRTRSDVVVSIERACRDNGIDIPFPHRVVHHPQ